MKARTIKAVLTKKHKAVLASISDQVVRAVFEKHAIVTGGAIASMLLNEKVSDFDYYFDNEHAAEIVAGYYLQQFLNRHDPENEADAKIVAKDGRVKIHVPNYGVLSEKAYEDNLPLSETEQIDPEQAGIDDFPEVEDSGWDHFRPIFLSSNAITLTNKVQIVIRFFGSPDEIHQNYDFEHCKCYWYAKTGELSLPQKSLLCLLNKELLYTGSKYPLCSIIRTRKFIQRGWQINAGQYVKMALQLNEFDLMNPDVLEDQLTGVDVYYFLQIINSVRQKLEADPNFSLHPEYLIEVIDRMFD